MKFSIQASPLYQLFDRFENTLKERELYRNPNLTVCRVAVLLRTDSSLLERAIYACTALPFQHYLDELRVHVAMEKIKKTGDEADLMIIMEESGFSSLSVFRDKFQSIFGVSPDYYRWMIIRGLKNGLRIR